MAKPSDTSAQGPAEKPPGGERASEMSEAIAGIRSSLEALKEEVGKPERTPEWREEFNRALGNLAKACKLAREKYGGVSNNPEWTAFETELARTISEDTALCRAAFEFASVQLTSELAELYQNFRQSGRTAADQEGAERAAPESAEQAGAAVSGDERLWGTIRTYLEMYIPENIRAKMNEWGIGVDDVQNMVASFFAALLENLATYLPKMAAISGGLRWRIAIAEAASDTRLNDQEKAQLTNAEKLRELQGKWHTLYSEWLQRKKTAEQNNAAFSEPPPGIYDALHKKPGGEAQTEQAGEGKKKLFGIEGLAVNGSVELPKDTPVKIEGYPGDKEVSLSQKRIKVGDKTYEFVTENNKPFPTNVSAPSDKPNELIVKFNRGQGDIKLEDLVKKIVDSGDEEEISYTDQQVKLKRVRSS